MMNKNLMAIIAATTISTTASAGFFLTGEYEGTFTDGNPGAATYAQDLDITMIGTNDTGTSVTATFENLTGGSTVKSTQVFVESSIEGISFKGGSYEGQNGSGLLQTTSSATNQFEVGFDAMGAGLTVGQVSGASKATADVSLTLAGVALNIQNATNSDRFISASVDVAGMGVAVERQKTTTGTNTAGSISSTVGGLSVTAAMMDINDASAVTQDDGLLGDISDATNGKTVKGVVVSTDTTFGTVTGKYITKNELDTYVAELERGVWTFGYDKTENADAVFSGKINVAF
jgi:hypothetical protein